MFFNHYKYHINYINGKVQLPFDLYMETNPQLTIVTVRQNLSTRVNLYANHHFLTSYSIAIPKLPNGMTEYEYLHLLATRVYQSMSGRPPDNIPESLLRTKEDFYKYYRWLEKPISTLHIAEMYRKLFRWDFTVDDINLLRKQFSAHVGWYEDHGGIVCHVLNKIYLCLKKYGDIYRREEDPDLINRMRLYYRFIGQ